MITKNDIRLLILEIIQEMVDPPNYVYHVTPTKHIPFMKVHGIVPKKPTVRFEPEAVYLFTNKEVAIDAIMNWLGDKFREDEPLVMLTISTNGLELHDSDVGYELQSKKVIPWSNVVKVENV